MDKKGLKQDGGMFIDETWLQSLWTYILETKSIELFKEVLPMVPVLGSNVTDCINGPTNSSKSSTENPNPGVLNNRNVLHLCRISLRIPILHMSYANLPRDAIDGLSELGIYILHKEVKLIFHVANYEVI